MKKQVIYVPQALTLLAENLISQDALRKENEKARAIEIEKQMHIASIARQKNGLCYAKKFVRWAHNLKESTEGRKLLATQHFLYLYDCHIPGVSWRALGISQSGVWWTRSGCGASPQIVASPERLADAIDFRILKEACAWIQSDKVWDCIKRRIKEPNWYTL